MWLFKLKLIKTEYNLKFSFSAVPATFQMLKGDMWLMATTLDSTETEISIIAGGSLGLFCSRMTNVWTKAGLSSSVVFLTLRYALKSPQDLGEMQHV